LSSKLSPLNEKETNLTGYLRGAKPLSVNHLPLPLIKGKGIKGIGLPNRDLKRVRFIKYLVIS
jgi:hypothetical protein